MVKPSPNAEREFPKEEESSDKERQPQPHKTETRIATSCTLFVTGLATAISRLHVEKMFGKYGQVERVDMKSSKTGATYCFCELDSVENAQKAMDNLNGRMLLHKRLVVHPANERKGSGQLITKPPPVNPAQESKRLDNKIELLKQKLREARDK